MEKRLRVGTQGERRNTRSGKEILVPYVQIMSHQSVCIGQKDLKHQAQLRHALQVTTVVTFLPGGNQRKFYNLLPLVLNLSPLTHCATAHLPQLRLWAHF